ncbi:MAG: MFS transporter, partial [Bacteroidetes bacterium]|nr:MFS transporter [Bacteroidota bacterium]
NEKKKLIENAFYKIPSPAELYIFLKEEKVHFNKNLTNPTGNASKYNTTVKKAINFGVYASDLAYCSLFEQNQQTLDYYAVAKQLGDELGIVEGFDESVAERIDKNINNSDSLYKITSEAYWDAYTYLESQEKTSVLPFISTGSWLESVHIAIESVENFASDDEVVARVVEQELLLENLLGFLNTCDKDENLDPIIKDLKELMVVFEDLYNNEDVLITKPQFDAISSKVASIRKQFVE